MIFLRQVLFQSLKELLDYEGNVEETFMQAFQISYQDVFGTNLTHVLKKDGEQVPVTNENRKVNSICHLAHLRKSS